MTDGACAWLPANALTDERMRDDFNQVVVAWSARWSLQGAMSVKTVSGAASGPVSVPSGSTGRIGGPISLEWSSRQARRLAGWALGGQPEGVSLSAPDRAVLEALGEEIAIDLTDSLARRFSIGVANANDQNCDRPGEIQLLVEGPDRTIRFRVFVPAAPLIRYRKSGCMAVAPVRQPLSFPASTLTGADVNFDVILGRSDLSLREVRSLEPDDVLVLATRVGMPVGVCRPDEKAPFLAGRFKRTESGISLTLCNPEAVLS